MGIVKTSNALSTCENLSCFVAGGLVLLLLAGCSGGGLPPVSDRSRATNTAAASGEYVVVAGDTLYSIAWRHQRDFRALAALNRINKPYDIFPGQRLRVKGSATAPAVVTASERERPKSKRPPAPGPAVGTSSTVPHPLSQTQPKPQRQPGISASRSSGTRSRPKVAQTHAPKPRNGGSGTRRASGATVGSSSGLEAQIAGSGPVKLRWPSTGTRLRSFGEQAAGAQKPSVSIDFLLKPGASIRSSAAGEVVYVGRGLAGFEQFVIVKHNDTWLSAYGFNAPAIVREKQLLSSGTVLATLASSRGVSEQLKRRRQLHFELRKNGTPVNPAAVIN